MTPSQQSERGAMALLAVLIVGVTTLAIALTLVGSSADSQVLGLVDQRSVQARNLATSCGEEALQVMHDSTAYVGTATQTLGSGTCTYTVTSTGTATRTIDTNGTIGNIVRKVKIYVTISSSSITILSWQDIGDA